MKVQLVIPNNSKAWIYPILKWRKLFAQKKIKFDIVSKPNFSSKNTPDIVLLTSRYYRTHFNNNNDYVLGVESLLVDDVSSFRKLGAKILFYDLSASSGSRELHLIKHVDLFLKRQLLKDMTYYTAKNDRLLYRPWVADEHMNLSSCDNKDISKIKLGWNLGFNDYSKTPNFLKRINFFVFDSPHLTSPYSPKPITCAFRGRPSGTAQVQRDKAIDILKEMESTSFVTGEIIPKAKFLKELEQSKAAISPFGHGEICYRDFEAIINGAILLKPSMSHMQTFPDIFFEDKTYIPLLWDLSDLKVKLQKVNGNYEYFRDIAVNAQEKYIESYLSFDPFYQHILKLFQ